MLFNSLSFLLFFPAVILVYYLIPYKAPQWVRNLWLLVASYYFYMSWNVKYVVLLLFSTLVTYVAGLLLSQVKNRERVLLKKALMAAGILANLAVLFFFKYFNFGANTFNILAEKLHIGLHINGLNLLLPVGISFYTFQALGYMIDVYRDPEKVEKNLLNYALFVSFFPQLVAGPIERSENLLPQLRKRNPFVYEEFCAGFQIMLYGYFLKLVIADRIAIFVDRVYGDVANVKGSYLLLASILFAFQIYCDFYGYSTIAVGAARVLGIQLMNNFESPYLAVSPTEFWRRWHISLSGWFRDYLYIPLGGNRKGRVRKYINTMIVFLVSGLWHGAEWSYVIWGGLNGLYQVVEGILGKSFRKKTNKVKSILATVITFILVDFSWIFFRSSDTATAFAVIKRIFDKSSYTWMGSGEASLADLNNIGSASEMTPVSIFDYGLSRAGFLVLGIALISLLVFDLYKKKGRNLQQLISTKPLPIRWLVYLCGLAIVLVFGVWGMGYNAANFIYFQF